MKKVKVFVLTDKDELIPDYMTDFSSGADVRANINKEFIIEPGKSALIFTGICVEIPHGFEIQVRPRSGLALKHQISVLNSPGTIDADFRGEIGVILINHGKEPFLVEPKMRIAQLVLVPVCRAEFIKKEQLEPTIRADGGFGHSGK